MTRCEYICREKDSIKKYFRISTFPLERFIIFLDHPVYKKQTTILEECNLRLIINNESCKYKNKTYSWSPLPGDFLFELTTYSAGEDKRSPQLYCFLYRGVKCTNVQVRKVNWNVFNIFIIKNISSHISQKKTLWFRDYGLLAKLCLAPLFINWFW